MVLLTVDPDLKQHIDLRQLPLQWPGPQTPLLRSHCHWLGPVNRGRQAVGEWVCEEITRVPAPCSRKHPRSRMTPPRQTSSHWLWLNSVRSPWRWHSAAAAATARGRPRRRAGRTGGAERSLSLTDRGIWGKEVIKFKVAGRHTHAQLHILGVITHSHDRLVKRPICKHAFLLVLGEFIHRFMVNMVWSE